MYTEVLTLHFLCGVAQSLCFRAIAELCRKLFSKQPHCSDTRGLEVMTRSLRSPCDMGMAQCTWLYKLFFFYKRFSFLFSFFYQEPLNCPCGKVTTMSPFTLHLIWDILDRTFGNIKGQWFGVWDWKRKTEPGKASPPPPQSSQRLAKAWDSRWWRGKTSSHHRAAHIDHEIKRDLCIC